VHVDRPDLLRVGMLCSAPHLTQAVQNVLSNAVGFSRTRIHMQLLLSPDVNERGDGEGEGEGGGITHTDVVRVVILVRDDGPGPSAPALLL
jgi:signal transduction histidine kinase